jgi:hypothetical protein
MEKVTLKIIKPNGEEFFIETIDPRIEDYDGYTKVRKGCSSIVYAVIPSTYAVIFHKSEVEDGDK